MSLLSMLAAMASEPPADPTGVLRAISNKAGTFRHGGVIVNQTTYQYKHTIRRNVPRIRFRFQSNWWGAAGTQVNLLLDGAAVIIGGTMYPLSFGGVPSTTITPGNFVTSDWINVPVAAGTVIQTRTCWAANSFHPVQTFQSDIATNGAGRPTAAGNYTVSGSGAIPILNVSENGHGPAIIEGETTSTGPSLIFIGDSIAEGGDDSDGAIHGFLAKGAEANSLPWSNFGVWADSPPYPGLGREGRFGNVLDVHTHGICEYPINTINAASTYNGPAGLLLAFWIWVADQGLKLWQTTLPPSNTSTDAWATLANQTVTTHEIARVGFNNWVRDGAPIIAGVVAASGTTDPTALRAGQVGHPLKGWIEVADTVESARDSGKWKVNASANYMTDDGTHPSGAAHALMAVPITAWAAAL